MPSIDGDVYILWLDHSQGGPESLELNIGHQEAGDKPVAMLGPEIDILKDVVEAERVDLCLYHNFLAIVH